MALIPRLNVNVDSITRKITVIDITGFFDAANNPNGYGFPNTIRTGIISATFNVYYNGLHHKSFDVTQRIKNAISLEIDLEIDFSVDDDGVYSFFLVVDSFQGINVKYFNYNNVLQELSQAWIRNNSSINQSIKNRIFNILVWANAMINGLGTFERLQMDADFTTLLRIIQRKLKNINSIF